MCKTTPTHTCRYAYYVRRDDFKCTIMLLCMIILIPATCRVPMTYTPTLATVITVCGGRSREMSVSLDRTFGRNIFKLSRIIVTYRVQILYTIHTISSWIIHLPTVCVFKMFENGSFFSSRVEYGKFLDCNVRWNNMWVC